MTIGIIGQGFVGNAIYQKFKNFYNIKTYDIDPQRCNSSEQETLDNRIVFICLPTPMNPDGTCNTALVDYACRRIHEFGVAKIAVIKSTIPPGTTEVLNKKYPGIDIIFNPEFLTERNAVEDFNNQSRVILGGPRKATTVLKQIYSRIFPKAHIVKTGSTHAELVKYFTNCFLATKVSFANEMYELAESLGLDYDKVVEYATLDPRLGNTHWAVPGPDGDYGYGGHCFPKDLSAIIKLTEEKQTVNHVLLATAETNNKVRTSKDWEAMKGRAVV